MLHVCTLFRKLTLLTYPVSCPWSRPCVLTLPHPASRGLRHDAHATSAVQHALAAPRRACVGPATAAWRAARAGSAGRHPASSSTRPCDSAGSPPAHLLLLTISLTQLIIIITHTPRRRLQERRKIRRSRCRRRPPTPLWLRRKAQRGSQASVARHRCTGRKPSPRKVEGRRRLRRHCPRTSHLRCPLLTTGGCRTNYQRRCKGYLHLQRCQPLPRL